MSAYRIRIETPHGSVFMSTATYDTETQAHDEVLRIEAWNVWKGCMIRVVGEDGLDVDWTREQQT